MGGSKLAPSTAAVEPFLCHKSSLGSAAGSYAELAYVTEDWAAPAPKNLSLETQAGKANQEPVLASCTFF